VQGLLPPLLNELTDELRHDSETQLRLLARLLQILHLSVHGQPGAESVECAAKALACANKLAAARVES